MSKLYPKNCEQNTQIDSKKLLNTFLRCLTRFRKKFYLSDILISTSLEVYEPVGAQKHETPRRSLPAKMPVPKGTLRMHF